MKQKIGFLNGTKAVPDASSIEYISLIINSILKEIASSVAQSARYVFLKEMLPRIFVLQRELSSLTQSQLSIETYRFKALLDQLINFQAILDCKCACTCS